jgi:hypothetical protein
MAWIKETKTDHLVVGWYCGRRIKTWLCPDLKTFTEFKEATALAKKQRRQVADPAITYGEFARPNVKATKKATADERRAAKLATKTTAASIVMMSAAAWVGDPGGGKPGPYFSLGHAQQMLPSHKQRYATVLRLYGSHFASKPMDTVTHEDAVIMLKKLLVCTACEQRARAAKRKDLLKSPWLSFGADQLPFDAACVDDDGESTHFSRAQNSHLKRALVLMKALWKIAKKAGQLRSVAGFAGLTENPFEHIGGAVPQLAQRATNDSLSQALSHTQLDLLNASMAEHCESLVLVTAYGLFRRSEVLGLMRGNIEWPTLPEHKGQARIKISQILDDKNQLRPWGKTPDATSESISLSKTATDALRAHLVKHRSTPNPACSTCAAGVGEILDSKVNNHAGCDFANNAPLWWDPKHKHRLWGDNFSEDYFAEACVKAGLTPSTIGFRPTVKLLRATGATLLLDAAVPITDVARMGRWTNIDTLQKHYHRQRDVTKTAAAAALDLDARGELGLSTQDDATLESRVRFQQRRIEVLESDLKEIHARLAANNIDLQALQPAPAPAPQRVENWWEDIDKVRVAVAKHSNQSAIIRALSHVTAQQPDYAKLAEVAALHDMELPPLAYSRGRTSEVA